MIRRVFVLLGIAAATVLPLTISQEASAWPSSCTHFFSNQFSPGWAQGRCTSGTGWYRTRVRCHPEGTTAEYVSRFGEWKSVQLHSGAWSQAFCGPRFPVAFDSDMFGSETNPT